MKKRNTVCRLGEFPQLTRTVFTSADGLVSDNITALCYGADGSLYVGTDRGLSKINGDKITAVDIGIEDAAISMLFCAAWGYRLRKGDSSFRGQCAYRPVRER